MRSFPLRNIESCDCRIQLLEALRLEVQMWRIGNCPDMDAWMRECAFWIAELPTEDLAQGWMAMLTFEINNHLGISIHTASTLLQQHVGEAMLRKGATA